MTGLRNLRWWPLALLTYALGCQPTIAATYYVRSDGGSALQCDGTRDSAYPGVGEHQPCAWGHPFDALPPGQAARISGGDTLIIGTGRYPMGAQTGPEQACSGMDPAECVLGPLPAGPSSTQPTRLLGAGHDQGCSAPPILSATGGASSVLQLERSNHVEVACLEITDASACIKGHPDLDEHCQGDGPDSGWGEYGIFASDSEDVLLRDLDIHGLAVNGIRAGRIGDWTLRKVRLRANGWAGWDGSLDGDENASNHGTIHFIGGEIAWNGCSEREASRQPYDCWAQYAGGYGDGLGTAHSGGDWVFEGVHIHHNTSDGLDLLYMDGTGSVTLRRVRAEGNAGNQIKITGPATIENTVAVGNCGFFAGRPDSGLVDADHCRASGNTVSLSPTADSLISLRNNTVTGQGDCLVVIVGGDDSARLVFTNNALVGGPQWGGKGSADLTCGTYRMDSDAALKWDHNLLWQLKDMQCPSGNICGLDPLLAHAGFQGFDAAALPGSPLIDAGAAVDLDQDFFNHPRPVGNGFDIGAVEFHSPVSADPAPDHGDASTTPPPAPGPDTTSVQ